MNYSLILLDADDTLFDYDRAERFALETALTHFGHTGKFDEVLETYRHINGRLWKDLENGTISKNELRTERFSRLFAAHDLNYDVHDFSDRYLGLLAQGSFLITGAEELCARLSVNHTLVVVTNGIRDVQLPRIQGSPLHPYIQDIVVSEEVGVNKPDPRIFEHALRKAGHDDKKSVLMVGDSLTSDIRGGNNFGIDTCWFNPGNVINTGDIVPTHQIGALSELVELA